MKELEAFFESQIDGLQLTGISASVIKEGRIAWSGGYGLADVETGIQVTTNTLFHIGSTSKTVIAAALMRLWERGAFALDDDINTLLPFRVRNPQYPDGSITFRMLLTHTSSISDVRPGAGTLPFSPGHRDSETPLEEILRGYLTVGGKYCAKSNYRQSAPGDRYEYSNISFSLIGYIIERTSGKSFSDFCRELLFDPKRRIGGAFFITGEFNSFEGDFVTRACKELLDASDKL